MLREYLPVLLQIIVAMLFAASALLVSVLVGASGKRTRAKDTAYECGMIPQGEAQPRFAQLHLDPNGGLYLRPEEGRTRIQEIVVASHRAGVDEPAGSANLSNNPVSGLRRST